MITESAELHLPPDIIIRGGASKMLGEYARRINLSRVLVITDPFMLENGPVYELAANLEDNHVETAIYGDVQPDPTVDNVDAALYALREHKADGIVAIGGGSPIDTAKAASILATNDGNLSDYAGYHNVKLAGLPLVAIPTTAGTGSEVTRVAVITDTERNVKMMMLDDNLMPRVALVDYQLTMTMPSALTAHVGLDSLTHAIEAYVSSRATVMTDMFALQAVRLLSRYLKVAFHEPSNEVAREATMLGATLAGMAFSNASVALVHGMSRPIGAHFHLPHGLSNAVLLPTVTRFSLQGAFPRYAMIAREMGVAGRDWMDEMASERLVEELESLNSELEVPQLRDLGVNKHHFDSVLQQMADAALASGSPSYNPLQPSAEEIVALYRKVY